MEEENTSANKNLNSSGRPSASFAVANQSTRTQSILKHKDDCLPIADLYDRMQRFKIICRINFICRFISAKNRPGTKMMLIDEHGDEILCLLMDKAAGN